jgi:hypothetical protein
MKPLAFAALLLPTLLVVSDAQSLAATPDPSEEPSALPAWAASLPDDDEITDARRDAIQHDAHELARSAPAGATRELLARLVSSDAQCGRAHAAALAGVFSARIDPADVAVALETASSPCDEVLVESAGFVPNPSRDVAVALLRRANATPDERVRGSAWLAYGSIAETARARSDGDLARSIDAVLVNRLAATSGDEHLLMVRAAGNAGCAACAPALAEDVTSSDARLRRAAIAAHRFLGTSDSVARMCGALERDPDGTARDLAAWALEWRSNDGADRARCLERAAASDGSMGVRLQAVRALGILADDALDAHDALGRLADQPGDVGALAWSTLEVRRGFEASPGGRMVLR